MLYLLLQLIIKNTNEQPDVGYIGHGQEGS